MAKKTTKAAQLGKKVVRSSETGKFVPKAEAKAKPAETITQTVPRAVKAAVEPKPEPLEDRAKVVDSLHMPEEAVETEMTAEDLVELARQQDALAQAPALSEEATAAHIEQETLNEAAKEFGFEPDRNAATHAIAVAKAREGQ